MIEAAPGQDGAFDTVLVVDFGAQYSQLIARRVRECEVYSEIVPAAVTAADIAARQPAGVILSGGPASVHVEGAPSLDPAIYGLGVPILGICYGAQLIAEQLGGSVGPNERGEYGRAEMTVTGDGGILLAGLPSSQPVWMSHFDAIAEPPPGATVTAATEASPVAAFEDTGRGLYGVQFHPEVEHTACGRQVLARFLRQGCGAGPSWSMRSIIDAAVASIRDQIGAGRAMCGLSGGVDSAVAAALVHRAIGDRLTCVLVDTGLLREGEADQVQDAFSRHFGVALVREDAADEFFAALAGVTEPEAKRKVVGEQFIRAFERARNRVPDAGFLVQGTLYPDVIESGATTHSSTIKSHHNVGGLPDDLDFELVEPLRSLFKDEVRAVGAELGLPEEIVHRQPFPGPGLAVRIIGEVTPEAAGTLRRRGRHRSRGVAQRRPGARHLAVVRGAPRHPDGRGHGRRAHLRTPRRDPGGDQLRRHDRRLGPPAPRRARSHEQPGHRRGARCQPGRLRHHLQAPRHHRMGVRARL